MTVTSVAASDLADKLRLFADPRFRFDPGPHKYWLDERPLVSSTTWLSDYKKPFVPADIAPGVAAGRGCTVEAVLAEWDRAGEIGTLTHNYIEGHYDFLRGLALAPPALIGDDDEVSLRCGKFLELAGSRLANYEAVAQELRMFYTPPNWELDEEAVGYCGTLDFLARHKPSGKLFIIDWKTSKKIDTDQDKVWRYMWHEFADLADHEHNVYSLQISFYRLLLESVGIETAGGAIAWLPTGLKPPALIPAIDYRARLRGMLL